MKLEKYTAPTQFDAAPYKTIWEHKSDNGSELWIQINQEDSCHDWMRIGMVMEKAFTPFVYDEKFTDMILRLYEADKH